MRRVSASGAAVAALAASALLSPAAAPEAGAALPLRGAFSGTTAAGEPFSMVVTTKKKGRVKRSKLKRWTFVGHVRATVPISCNSGQDRSEGVGFPGPLTVGGRGRFGVAGVARWPDGARVSTTVTGRFTGKRVASGTLTYRGGPTGEFCSGETSWTARRTER